MGVLERWLRVRPMKFGGGMDEEGMGCAPCPGLNVRGCHFGDPKLSVRLHLLRNVETVPTAGRYKEVYIFYISSRQ